METACKQQHSHVGDVCQCNRRPAMNSNELIKELSREAEPEFLEENLHEMFLAFVAYWESPTKEFREEVITTYLALRRLIRGMKAMQ